MEEDFPQASTSGKRQLSDDELVEVPEKKRKKPATSRQRWTETEVQELSRYFQRYLESGTTPRGKEIEKAKTRSLKNDGDIWKRTNHLIIKKISNMNHK